MKKNPKRKDLIYPELSYQIIGILFKIWNELGPGYQERYYQRAVIQSFGELNIKFEEQLPVRIKYQKQNIGVFYLDFLVKDKVILEIKRKEYFSKNNIEQVYAYLQATGLKLGIIANFTSKGLQFKRIVNID